MSIDQKLRLLPSEPPELLVYDKPSECSYLDDQIWRLPLRLPVRMLDHHEFAQRLQRGDRRQGRLLYRTECATCRACEPIRLDLNTFRPSKSQRRALQRAGGVISVSFGPVEVTRARVELYNLHKQGRGLARNEEPASLEAYRAFLGDTCVDSFEMRYRVADELVGVAIVDRAENALSAVYFYYHPELQRLSPGVFSIMKQVELCKRLKLRWLYLGLYIEPCPSMSYKGRYLPHERLIDGHWRKFDRSAHDDFQRYRSPEPPDAD
jgi:arginine-tRNA-protein transferase